MSEDDLNQIRPKSVPLSHIQEDTAASGRRRSFTGLVPMLAGVTVLALLLAVFLVLPDLVRNDRSVDNADVVAVAAGNADTASPPTGDLPQANRSGSPATPETAPFAALQREQARAKAQEKLAEFVELQLLLEESMQVGSWGDAQLEEAKNLATEGDELFLREDFAAALTAYDNAAVALSALIDTGRSLLDTALAEGLAALDVADQTEAEAQFTLALTIDPDNAAAKDGMQRAALLPEIIVLMRQGKNHELAGAWDEALAVYRQVQQLDPETHGLSEALAEAELGVTENRIRSYLSEGFAAMEQKRFQRAKQSFLAALKLDPDNTVARGGLEQVSRRTDLTEIEQLRESATTAEAAENWQQAIADYDRVLKLDPNIQFAKDGRERAGVQYRTQVALAKIIANPDKLSSPQLFDQAKEILARAERLTPRGATLTAQTTEVAELIRVYSTPVAVTIQSDNATQVTLSTVGVLGTFAEKQLSLRPGAYTLIGSRNGFRDVREQMLVRPDMAPFDIRCTETF